MSFWIHKTSFIFEMEMKIKQVPYLMNSLCMFVIQYLCVNKSLNEICWSYKALKINSLINYVYFLLTFWSLKMFSNLTS